PGACAGWFDLIARHGTLPMATILAPAIELAEAGFAVGEVAAFFWADGLVRQAGAANLEELTIGGRAPRAGQQVRNPGPRRPPRQARASSSATRASRARCAPSPRAVQTRSTAARSGRRSSP